MLGYALEVVFTAARRWREPSDPLDRGHGIRLRTKLPSGNWSISPSDGGFLTGIFRARRY